MRNKIDLTDTFVGRKYDRFSNASAIDKSERYKKMIKYERLLKGTDDRFFMPHSRHTTVKEEDIKKCKQCIKEISFILH